MMLTKLYDDMLQGPWKTTGLDVQYKIDSAGTLTFQCTSSAGDWIQNFRFWRKAYKNMDVGQQKERWDSIETPYETLYNSSWRLDNHTHSITITTQYSANHMPRYITLKPIVKV